MKLFKRALKYTGILLFFPVIYIIIGLLLSFITINKTRDHNIATKEIFLHTNGVHLDIIIPKKDIDPALLKGILQYNNEDFIAFGWGEENFYINTPNWNDLTFKNTFRALFLKNNTLLHIRRYKHKRKSWLKIAVTLEELKALNQSILADFKTDVNNTKIIIPEVSYGLYDNFYKAHGNYSLFKTCNSWVNTMFKRSGLKACFWTPFDFGLLNKYR